MSALEVSNVSYAYQQKTALRDVSLSVGKGEFAALLGPNGAGKSTLFSLICHLFRTSQGRILINGIDVARDPVAALRHVGLVFQVPTLDLDLTVSQNLHYFASLRGLSRRHAEMRIDDELTRLDLADARSKTVRQLNGGHRRRVELARALLHQPALLLLDEPTVGLDVPTRRHFVDYVHGLTAERDVAVLWATHLIDEIDLQRDQLIILNQGTIAANDTAARVVAETGSDDLQQAYQMLTRSEIES